MMAVLSRSYINTARPKKKVVLVRLRRSTLTVIVMVMVMAMGRGPVLVQVDRCVAFILYTRASDIR